MAPHLLQREHRIPKPIEEVIAVFADARNLDAIRPSDDYADSVAKDGSLVITVG